MAENSKIEWTDHTFSPWIGCQKVSAACDHCYAEAWDKRFKGDRWGPHAERTVTKDWRKVYAWNRKAQKSGVPAKVFSASMADVFDNHQSIDPAWREQFWRMVRETQWLVWFLLTKRPQNIKQFLPPDWGIGYPNVWLGTTVENQTEANRRIPHLLAVPAKVRFLSCEPLLGPIDFDEIPASSDGSFPPLFNSLAGYCRKHFPKMRCGCDKQQPSIDWVIAGGESGPKARPSHLDWFRSLRDQCVDADVPFFFKQMGEWAPYDLDSGGQQDWMILDQTGNIDIPDYRTPDVDAGECAIRRIGKKAAGRSLDGALWDQVPGVGE
jgi:protein gp37